MVWICGWGGIIVVVIWVEIVVRRREGKCAKVGYVNGLPRYYGSICSFRPVASKELVGVTGSKEWRRSCKEGASSLRPRTGQ